VNNSSYLNNPGQITERDILNDFLRIIQESRERSFRLKLFKGLERKK